jgi:hypothetical protein
LGFDRTQILRDVIAEHLRGPYSEAMGRIAVVRAHSYVAAETRRTARAVMTGHNYRQALHPARPQ